MTGVTGATCSVTPALPAGVSMAQGTCAISGTPNSITSNTTYTITANISNTNYSTTIWISTSSSSFGIITSSVEGADLTLGEAMGPITLNYTSQAPPSSVSSGNNTTWGGTCLSSTCAMEVNGVFREAGNYLIYADAQNIWATNTSGQYWLLKSGGTYYHTSMNNMVYFESNNELWKTDGTISGTVKVSSINPFKPTEYYIIKEQEMTVLNNEIFFPVINATNGAELWKSDGTNSGTVKVMNLTNYSSSAINNQIGYFQTTVFNNTLVFMNHNHTTANGHKWQLVSTDGTASGKTVLYNGSISLDKNMIEFQNELYFQEDNKSLMKTDGTAGGTTWVFDQYNHNSAENSFFVWENYLYFNGWDVTNYTQGKELWKTDGTTSGTVQVANFVSDAPGQWTHQFNGIGIPDFYAWNETHFAFNARTSQGQNSAEHLYITDGTENNTSILLNGRFWTSRDSGDVVTWGHAIWIGDIAYYGVGGGHGVAFCYTDFSGAHLNLTSSVSETCFPDYNSGQYTFDHGYGAAHSWNDELYIVAYRPDVIGNSGDFAFWSYAPGNVTLSTPPPVSWETDPALPAGMSISNGIISGTPSVYANNQTYTVYANQSGNNTTIEMWFSVDSENPHTVVENQTIDAIGFHPPFNNGTTSWGIAPTLPANLSMNTLTGEITGIMNQTLTNTTFAVTATHSGGATQAFSFNLESLADFDGDGLPNQLPSDYNTAEPPTPGLIEDLDDDADGLPDLNETDTGTYVDESDTGTDPLDPDSDDDGICDGPNAVPPICIAGPDPDPNGVLPPPTLVGINNTAINDLTPYMSISGGTYEISPNLPAALSLDVNNGEITGTPTQTLSNTTFTVWVNHTDGSSQTWDFTVEILEDTDGDGLPNELPGDYNSSNPDSPGLSEDMDDDADGISDIDEENDGTDSLNPDTDGDGMCDGEIPSTYFDPNCVAGPDAFPTDPSGDTDTDGDGKPDTLNPPSNSDPALVEDFDDDGDGIEDVNETNSGINNGPNDPGTDPLDPDTDDDGICDGPNDVYDKQGNLICIGGPDPTPLGEAASGVIYGLNNSQLSSLVPPYQLPDAAWEISPSLPQGLSIDPVNGIIGGIPTEITGNISYTIYGNSSTSTITFDFNLQILEDTDRDGEPNELPIDYPVDGSLIEDLDDDGDGASDLNETGTGIYNGTGDMGTDPLDPDTDDDGICDGPNDVLPQCIGGPDSNPFGTGPLGPTVLVNNTMTAPLLPANAVPGATWELSPQLPAGLTFDSTTGIITGTPTQTMDNTTFTMWANTTVPSMSIFSTFWLEVLEDTDGDGMPDTLPEDYPDTNPPYDLIEDLDDDNDGMSDEDEALIDTDPTNPDTDGDGFCDGNGTGDGNCYAGPDSHPLDPLLPVNTDGDGFPDDDPDGEGGLIADDDDDNDGFLDTREMECESDPLNATDIPQDLDGDGICDAMDDDIDGDGLFNLIENDSGIYNSSIDTGTDPRNADTDGDGVCDGPASPVTSNCTVGPDAFPLDPAAHTDTDGDGFPDELFGNSTSTPPLELDLDDDNDAWSDLDEAACGTDSLDDTSIPADTDADGVCDALDDILDLPFNLTYPLQNLQLTANQEMSPFLPNITGAGDVATWEISGELPEGLTFGWSPARDAALDGSIRGTPTEVMEMTNFTIWANNSAHSQSYEISLTIVGQDEVSDDGFNWMWCFPMLLLLLMLLLIPLILNRDRILLLLADGPEPENTTATPEFLSGAGTQEDPFILEPVEGIKPGTSASSIEVITISKMSPISVEMIDINQGENGNKFCMYETSFDEIGTRLVGVGEDGDISIHMMFDDDNDDPTYQGGEFTGLLKLGSASVYFSWTVKVDQDKAKVKEIQAEAKAAKKAEEAEAKAAKKAEEAEANDAMAEEEAEAAMAEEEAEAAKEAEEAEANDAMAEEEAEAALDDEEAEAAKKAEEAEAKAALAEIKKAEVSMTKEEKKAAGIERVKAMATEIDFETLGVASASEKDDLQTLKGIGPYIEEKLNALGIYTFKQISNMKGDLEDQVNIAIEFFPGRVKRDQWVMQAKELLKK
jgi:ELWxxDGT repeat protein